MPSALLQVKRVPRARAGRRIGVGEAGRTPGGTAPTSEYVRTKACQPLTCPRADLWEAQMSEKSPVDLVGS